MSVEEDLLRYTRAAHALQTAVQLDHARTGAADGTPKHLRVGINLSKSDQAALVQLLISKGILTEAEYIKALADQAEAEVRAYQKRLGLPENVKLG